mmetsp:Transcript_14279/g.30249  ORF Transcript_14279/g.30249 Transcript_14279/m.30249 type:complete len:464 (-) Transcript_14279:120-1511(-)
MNPNGLVEILLGGPHLDGNSDPLDHVSRSIGGNVASHDLVGCRFDNDLHHGIHFYLGEGVCHGFEPGLENRNVFEFLGGFLLRVSDGSQLGGRKDRRGHELVVHRTVHPAKDRVGQGMSFHEGNRRQGHAIGNVAHRVDARDVRARIFVDGNEGSVGDEFGNGLEPDVVGLSNASGCVHDLVAIHAIAIAIAIPGNDREGSVVVLDDFRGVCFQANIDVRGSAHFLVNVTAHVAIKASQEHLPAVEESNLGPESVHDLCEFAGNESSTDNDHPLGLLLQIENLVGGNGVLDPGNVRLEGPTANTNKNVLGRNRSGATAVRESNLDRVFSVELAEALANLDARPLQNELVVDVVQPRDLRVLGLHKVLPRKGSRLGAVPSVSLGFGDGPRIPGSKHHELFGDAANVDAGSTDCRVVWWPVLHLALDQEDLGSVAGGHPRSPDTAGTSSDDDQVVIKVGIGGVWF